ncbi:MULTISPECIES: amidase family protein [unclassified Phenylobacterium]|uniref:amidase family protein n=1 Tax=unclassified Phenylobacterium TaxID=2640670 RepID=UPI00083B330D|nr:MULTISPECIES: amidase family protein [unclassified Phenylobacterium]
MSSEITRRAVLAVAGAGLPATAAAAAAVDRVRRLIDLTATEALAHIRDGSLKAEDYASALLTRRAAAADHNALTWIDADRVMDQARRADRARASGRAKGRLAGLPVVIKDNIDTLGFPTSAGTALLKTQRPRADAGVARALFRDGAILLAKTNMHELAGGGTSNNPVFGPVRNPYDRTRIAGGSSGGTAAAVALRFAPVGLGTDTAGSVRIPASFCGLAGLRPTIAGAAKLYPDDGIVPLAASLDTAGPLGRSVADLALIHAAVTGTPAPAPAALRGLRLGLPEQHYWAGLDAEVERVCRAAVARLADAGVVFVPVDISSYIGRAQQLFGGLFMSGMRDDLDAYFRRQGQPFSRAMVVAQIASRDTRAMFEAASRFPRGAVSVSARADLLVAYHQVLREVGVEALCFPTVPTSPPPIGTGGDGPDDTIEIGGQTVPEHPTLPRNTVPVCALGAPGLTLPTGLTSAGLPVGLEIEGPAGSDTRLLAIGQGFEALLGRLLGPG